MNLEFLTVFGTIIPPILALLFGILILILPRVLNFLVAIYLIIVGILGILGLLTLSPP